MVFQQPWHGFVPGGLVVSVLGCKLRIASSSRGTQEKQQQQQKTTCFSVQ